MPRRKIFSDAAKSVCVKLEPEDLALLKRLAKARGGGQGKVIRDALKLLAAAIECVAHGGEVVFLKMEATEAGARERIVRALMEQARR